jgi:hypothetical protein
MQKDAERFKKSPFLAFFSSTRGYLSTWAPLNMIEVPQVSMPKALGDIILPPPKKIRDER